jgi:hypothetical protein
MGIGVLGAMMGGTMGGIHRMMGGTAEGHPSVYDGRYDGRHASVYDGRYDGRHPSVYDGRYDGRHPSVYDGRHPSVRSTGSDGLVKSLALPMIRNWTGAVLLLPMIRNWTGAVLLPSVHAAIHGKRRPCQVSLTAVSSRFHADVPSDGCSKEGEVA